MNGPFVCPCCFLSTMIAKFDRKGRPFASCGSCGSRMFIRSLHQLANLTYAATALEQVAEIALDPSHPSHGSYRTATGAFVRRLLTAQSPTPARNEIASMTAEEMARG